MSNDSKKQGSKNGDGTYDVIVVGAGAAGVGVAITLQHVGIENFLIVDRECVGASFAAWPAETRFITPSFPSNSIGMLDLNSFAYRYLIDLYHACRASYRAAIYRNSQRGCLLF